MANSVVRLSLSEIAASVALGVNLTNADVVAKYKAGPNQLSSGALDSVSVGGICADKSGNIFVSDSERHTILKISGSGTVSILAGIDGTSGNNGTLTNVAAGAMFNAPRGLACDNSGNVYVADSENNQIRLVTPDGKVSHLAGAGDGTVGFVDGAGAAARLDTPMDVAVDNSGVVWFADTGNNSIRRIKGGTVYTFSGDLSGDSENVSSAANAAGANGIYNSPVALAVDAGGDIYVCDTGNNKIKLLKPNGHVYLFSGSGASGKTKGTTAFTGEFNNLRQCTCDNSGNLYVIDKNTTSGTRVIRIQKTGVQEIVNDWTGATNYNDEVEGIVVNPSGRLYVAVSDSVAVESSSSSSSDSSSSSSSSA
jgi:sugar lactone lactonase YvrE